MTIITSIGLMTGSSMDGIDASVIETDGMFYVKRLANSSVDFYPNFHLALRVVEYSLQQELGNLKNSEKNFIKHSLKYIADNFPHLKNFDFSILDAKVWQDGPVNSKKIELLLPKQIEILLTEKHAVLVKQLIEKLSYNSNTSIDYKNSEEKHKSSLLSQEKDSIVLENLNIQFKNPVVAMHGQTVYHNPKLGVSLQLGDGKLLSQLTGFTVINNFRQEDIKNGGQGAPLAPLYHLVTAHNKKSIPLVIINCGGISNISIIENENPEHIIGFDSGPGNVLLDRYMRCKTENKEFMDFNGIYGSKGIIDENILDWLKINAIDQDFWSLPYPKSLDSSDFKLPEDIFSLSIENACATLAFFTAWSIVKGLEQLKNKLPNKIILAGGGWKNPVIKGNFVKLINDFADATKHISILDADEFGFSSQYMEAETFAYLAARKLLSLPTSYPKITGVKSPTSGGDIHNDIIAVPKLLTKNSK